MLGKYGDDTNSMRYRDVAEYATMLVLNQAAKDMRAQGIKVTPAKMQELRDNWTRDGEAVDFTTMRAKPSDFANLLESTGANDYGELGQKGAPDAGRIADLWKAAREEYTKLADDGVFLHTVTDPELREHAFDGVTPVNKAIFAHQGKSLRELNPGDALTLTAKRDKTPIYTGTVQSPSQAAPAPERPAAAPTPVSQSQPEPAPSSEDFSDDNDVFVGWDGGEIDGVAHRGLSDIFGAYLTKADTDIVSKNIDPDQKFDPDLAYNALELLSHMRSKGYAFNVKNEITPNKINVALGGAGDNTSLRVFDPADNGKYIGRVYDKFNTYYTDVSGGKETRANMEYSATDATRVIDYVMGDAQGKVTKAKSTDTSKVTFDDMGRNKHIRVVPSTKHNDIYRALKYTDAEEARAFIEDGIDNAQRFVDAEFKAEDLQALFDKGLDSDDILVTGPEFQAELELMYSMDPVIREAQERAASVMKHSDDNGMRDLQAIKAEIVGDYESGFNPAFVNDHMGETDKGNNRDALMAAMKYVNYDTDKLKGNSFAVDAMKERLVTFDPETAKGIDEIDHPMKRKALETVRDTLKAGKFVGRGGWGHEPDVKMDDQGIVRWEANRHVGAKDMPWHELSGEIGQVMVPDENGIIKTQFQNDNNYGIVPGYTGYFSFDGDYDDRMSRFRVKGFEQHLSEQLKAKVTHQMTRPYDKTLEDIPTTLDASSLNGLYHGDVYGKRIDLDFMEVNQLDTDDKSAILQTLSNRVRFDNQYSDYATTSAETQANREVGAGKDTSAFSYWKAAGETNMRVLGNDIENYADLTMTGTGKTQGLIWYLADGAKVNEDGSVTPSEGMIDKNGERVPDQTALKKLPYFDKEQFNAWDRTQMSANQMMTALKVDKGANTALMSFGGWTFDDSYAVSKEFAERNMVKGAAPSEASMSVLDRTIEDSRNYKDKGFSKETALEGTGMMWSDEVLEEGAAMQSAILDADSMTRPALQDEYAEFLETHGTFRPLQRGDKLSDFGGNKGTIGIVIDRDMDPEKAEKEGLSKEVAFMKANPDLDVISAPYSMLSRHNAGVVKELMDGEPQDLVNPETGETMPGAMGKLNIIVTDMVVDKKTHAYSREDVLDGKGRKASGQLAWALQAKGADGILNEIYGRNDSAWSTYREYLIATGLDMKPDGALTRGYTPHADEDRHHFQYDPEVESDAFLNEIQSQGGFLDTPFEVKFKTGESTNEVPVLSASLRQNVELVDGSMRRSDFTNSYEKIYNAIGAYTAAEEAEDAEGKEAAQASAQNEFDKIQSTIIDRQFNGGHNGKHSYIRDKIMGKRMQHSATGVAMVDPRLDIGDAGMNQEMMDALDAEEGDTVMMFRDPVWRDGAIRAMKVKHDESVHGVSFNPITDKSHDGDFDGDTYGMIKFDSAAANADLENKFSHWANMIDKGNGKEELYFQSGMDLASAEAHAASKGDDTGRKLYEQADKQARSEDPRVLRLAEKNLSKYSHNMFRDNGFATDYVSFTDDKSVEDSFQRMVDNKAKGKPEALKELMEYHNGEKTMADARDVQYATGVKSDDTGLAGAFSQKLVSVMRNDNIKGALESMYPLTQGTLQIKKDAKKARTVNEILTDDMNKVFNAKHLDDPRSDSPMSPKKFKRQLTDTLTGKMGVDVAEDHIDAVTETLTVDGRVVPLKDAMSAKGAPMDRVAYGGGYEELKRIADKGESLIEGRNSELFAPMSMRNATEETKIAKRDTQRVVVEESSDFGVDVRKSAVSGSTQAAPSADNGIVL